MDTHAGWQRFVDNELMGSKVIAKACIAGLDGSVWASSNECGITEKELKDLIAGLAAPTTFTSNGVIVAGQKYIYLSGTEKIVRAKKGNAGVHCMMCGTCVIVSTYNEGVNHQQVAQVVEKLGDYLESFQY